MTPRWYSASTAVQNGKNKWNFLLLNSMPRKINSNFCLSSFWQVWRHVYSIEDWFSIPTRQANKVTSTKILASNLSVFKGMSPESKQYDQIMDNVSPSKHNTCEKYKNNFKMHICVVVQGCLTCI